MCFQKNMNMWELMLGKLPKSCDEQEVLCFTPVCHVSEDFSFYFLWFKKMCVFTNSFNLCYSEKKIWNTSGMTGRTVDDHLWMIFCSLIETRSGVESYFILFLHLLRRFFIYSISGCFGNFPWYTEETLLTNPNSLLHVINFHVLYSMSVELFCW